ncbi:MAG: flavodoxin, partial [Anaerovoracaceae bacterium]
MSKALVAYFSATGTTARLAETIAETAGADLFEIVPVKSYSSADLNWNNKSSRSTAEMNDANARPEIAEKVE